MIDSVTSVPINKIESQFLSDHNIELFLQRDDLIHPYISGNKWRKLKWNIQKFKEGDYTEVITFGGAYSNHIAATAAAGKEFSIPTVGIIRGEETLPLNPTLQLAAENGMQLQYISRTAYKNRNEASFLNDLKKKYPKALIIPEGGANKEGLKGCTEITEVYKDFDTVMCACGTGSTFAGIVASLNSNQKAIGVPVLKNANFLNEEVNDFLDVLNQNKSHWKLNLNYHFGGYAKYEESLLVFMRSFHKETLIKLDPIYTGKMMFALYDLIQKKELANQRVLAIHTGGLQGITGFEKRYNNVIFH